MHDSTRVFILTDRRAQMQRLENEDTSDEAKS
jgi:hypothetical protein